MSYLLVVIQGASDPFIKYIIMLDNAYVCYVCVYRNPIKPAHSGYVLHNAKHKLARMQTGQ